MKIAVILIIAILIIAIIIALMLSLKKKEDFFDHNGEKSGKNDWESSDVDYLNKVINNQESDNLNSSFREKDAMDSEDSNIKTQVMNDNKKVQDHYAQQETGTAEDDEVVENTNNSDSHIQINHPTQSFDDVDDLEKKGETRSFAPDEIQEETVLEYRLINAQGTIEKEGSICKNDKKIEEGYLIGRAHYADIQIPEEYTYAGTEFLKLFYRENNKIMMIERIPSKSIQYQKVPIWNDENGKWEMGLKKVAEFDETMFIAMDKPTSLMKKDCAYLEIAAAGHLKPFEEKVPNSKTVFEEEEDEDDMF
jgi:uncharacterized protein YpmB